MEKLHTVEWINIHNIAKKIDTDLIVNYNDFINKSFKCLDSTEEYNKKTLFESFKIYIIKINMILGSKKII